MVTCTIFLLLVFTNSKNYFFLSYYYYYLLLQEFFFLMLSHVFLIAFDLDYRGADVGVRILLVSEKTFLRGKILQ